MKDFSLELFINCPSRRLQILHSVEQHNFVEVKYYQASEIGVENNKMGLDQSRKREIGLGNANLVEKMKDSN